MRQGTKKRGDERMEILKNVQTILLILHEHKIQISIILCLICLLNVFLNIAILNKSAYKTDTKSNKEN